MTTASSPATPDYDLAIVGAGPVGLALAGWLARRSATRHASIALIDAREPAASANDPRAIAVSHGSRVLLDTLAWPADATPIEHIHVSQRGHFGRTLIDRDEHALAALGYVVRYGSIVQALAGAVRGTRVDWLTSTTAHTPQQDADGVTLTLDGPQGGRTLRARIVINAEGGLFHEQQADAGKHRRDYGQTALVGTVTVSAPRPNVAWERFTHEGPLALLPLGGPRQADYSLVWCCTPDEAARRAALPDDAFLRELGSVFGERMGEFVTIAGRASFPLGLNAAQTLVSGRIAIVGNAAQTLHPVAGQGSTSGCGTRTRSSTRCPRKASKRPRSRPSTRAARLTSLTIGATDTLARLFTIDAGPLPLLRGAALTALEFVPPLKKVIARQMMFGQRN